ncbi:FAD-dependent oxidoreductase [Clostridioides difficile]|nr:FAD-dependent oxidoreductase [Clostridioides difficile]HBG2820985.1 FAD-dependent oxidoreductase [Clostridioides difficile]HBG2821254.1 FAD-dependent oxidoreductase [Clostridioides difficile]
MSLKSLKIKENLYWVGSLDPDLRVFDIIMYTPYGTTYNSYVLKGTEKTVLFETVKDKHFDNYIERLNDLNIDFEKIDYIVVSHTEPDHAGSVEKLLDLAKNAKVVASETAIKYLKEIVNKDFEYVAVTDGDTLSIGDKTLEFFSVPMLHWPDTIYTYIKEDKTLVTCDSFGSHYSNDKIVNTLDENEEKDYLDALRYYYDCIMDPFKPSMVTAIEKIKDLDIDTVCPGHGPVLTENPRKIIDLYYNWSVNEQIKLEKEVTICYVSAHGYTKIMAEAIKAYIEKNSNYKVNLFDVIEHKQEDILAKIAVSQGVLFGTPTILGDALKPIWDILISLNPVLHGGKVASVFGSYGWSGEGIENAMERISQLRMTAVKPFAVNFKPSNEEIDKLYSYTGKFLDKLNSTFGSKKKTKKFKCVICNEVFEGDSAPSVCPVCGAKEDQFIEVEEDEVTFRKDTDEYFVIVGNGAAGFYAADAIRKRNKTCKITMISNEDELTYYRPALSDGINEELGSDFYMEDKDWYDKNNIVVILGTNVDKLDEVNKTIIVNDGAIKFDKLVIATGSRNFIPPIKGHDLENVFTLRNIKDLYSVKEALEKSKKVVVIGGGLLGLEAAWEFRLKGLEVVVVEAMDSILSKQLDKEGSKILEQCVRDTGIDVRLGVAVDGIEGDGKAQKVVFKDGDSVDCDMVVFSIGVRANTQMVQDTSVKIDRGIVVDKTLQTNVKDIYACGDVAQVGNISLAIWPSSVEMGKIAGANASGDNLTFESEVYPVSLDAMNVKVFSIGNIQNFDKEISSKDEGQRIYKKLFMKDGSLVGAILINDLSCTVKLIRLISEKGDFEDIMKADIL